MLSRKNREGATLVEIIVVGIIMLMVTVLLAAFVGLGVFAYKAVNSLDEGSDVSERKTAEENAFEFFEFTYKPDPNTLVVECMGGDTSDGYTVCAGKMEIDGEHYRYAAECSGNWPISRFKPLPAEGCKWPE